MAIIRQLTIGHRRWDTRIWVKQVATLRDAGLLSAYEVADGQGDACVDGVEIHDLGKLKGRGFWPRVRHVIRALRRSGLRREEILHFHDPLFLPGAIWLKIKGYRIVYDVHEDYPRQVLNWELPAFIRYSASLSYAFMEWLAGRLFDGIVTATPKIAERFPSNKTVVVQNFPMLGELSIDNPIVYSDRPPIVTYMGGITRVRGINEIVRAMGMLPNDMKVKLILAGSFDPLQLKDEVSRQHGWEKVEYCGWQSRERLKSILSKTRVGLVVLHPVTNYLESYPVKLFEYMSAGIPVVASDFPLWRKIVEDAGCGLLVDPKDPSAIAGAIQWLLEHPKEAEAMGQRGRQAVEDHFNWDKEAIKLLKFYQKRCNLRARRHIEVPSEN
jgi:glycosyltransferase involved in cell wall biosynthesis